MRAPVSTCMQGGRQEGRHPERVSNECRTNLERTPSDNEGSRPSTTTSTSTVASAISHGTSTRAEGAGRGRQQGGGSDLGYIVRYVQSRAEGARAGIYSYSRDLGYIVRYVQSRAEYEYSYRTSSRQEVLYSRYGIVSGRTDARMDTPEQTKFVTGKRTSTSIPE